MSGLRRFGRAMLAVAWIVSALCVLPPSVIFRTEPIPTHSSCTQCASRSFWDSPDKEATCNVSDYLLLKCMLPILIGALTYSRILYKLVQASHHQRDLREGKASGKIVLRERGEVNARQARLKTLRLTVILILLFVLCWHAFAAITLWYMFEQENGHKLNPDAPEGL